MKVKVYRFERNGVGPYSIRKDNVPISKYKLIDRLSDQLISNCDLKTHPNMPDDVLFKPQYLTPNYITACRTKEQLEEWFKYSLETLNELGFKIKEYEVDEKYIIETKSKKQVAMLNPQYWEE